MVQMHGEVLLNLRFFFRLAGDNSLSRFINTFWLVSGLSELHVEYVHADS
jgi:hypothetical protein